MTRPVGDVLSGMHRILKQALGALVLIGATAAIGPPLAVPALAGGPALLRCGANVNCNDGASVLRAMDRAAKRIETVATSDRPYRAPIVAGRVGRAALGG